MEIRGFVEGDRAVVVCAGECEGEGCGEEMEKEGKKGEDGLFGGHCGEIRREGWGVYRGAGAGDGVGRVMRWVVCTCSMFFVVRTEEMGANDERSLSWKRCN